MTRTIKHEFFFAHPAETVWEHLTNPELMAQWLMKNDFQPVVGYDFQFNTGAIPGLNFDGTFYCKVLEIDPMKKLSYSWKSGPGNREITLESIVVWKLESRANGTQVFLEHSGFEHDDNLDFFNGLNHGWVEKFQKIDQLLKAATHANTNA